MAIGNLDMQKIIRQGLEIGDDLITSEREISEKFNKLTNWL